MAAFAGLIDFEGRPPDETLLQRTAEAYPAEAFGDATLSVMPGCGFVMRPLRATFDPPVFEWPVDDGRFVVVGDTRIDDRSELVRLLDDSRLSDRSGDGQLVPAAFVKWGTECVRRLTGEFALVVWDREARRVFMARDQFGARPLYYARFGSKLAVASSTRALRRLVEFDPELSPETVADYIVLGELTDRSATFFEGLSALPPAHAATVTEGRLDVSRYWHFPEECEVRVSRREELREELRRLLDVSVRDRLRSNRVSIQLSGGLDSAALAVVAKDELGRRSGALSGLTMSHEALFEDDEPRLAAAIGDRLDVPVTKISVDDWNLWQDTATPGPMTRERPGWGPFVAAWRAVYDVHAVAGPIVLSGDGGDYVFNIERQPLRWWWRRGDYGAIVLAAARALRHGIRPRAGLRSAGPPSIPATGVPDWLEPELVRMSGIEERTGEYVVDDRVWSGLPRASFRAALIRVRIEQEFELSHPTVTHRPVVYTLPFFDRRLVEHAFSWAPFPWLERKFVVRDAMAGRLPDEVLRRPKRGLAGDPLESMIEAGLTEDLPVERSDLSGLCVGDVFPITPPVSDLGTIALWCRAVETALWRRSLT